MDSAVLIAATITVAFFVEGLTGFGGGMIAVPALTLIVGVKDAVFITLLYQLLMSTLLIKTYKHLPKYECRQLLVTSLVGALCGFGIWFALPVRVLELAMAITILAFVLLQLSTARIRQPKWSGQFAGFVGGFLQASIGMGGPPLTMYLTSRGLDKFTFRATIIWALAIMNFMRLFASATFTPEYFLRLLPSLPLATIGFVLAVALGSTLHARISEKFFRQIILLILTTSSILILTR